MNNNEIRKEITVAVPQSKAYEVFTTKMSKWWPRKNSIGTSPIKDIALESRIGGRWYEIGEDGAECEWGKVLEIDAPNRIVLSWQINGAWKFDPEFITELEITFVPVGEQQTRVELTHRNLDRYGEQTAQIHSIFASDQGWIDTLRSFAEEADRH